MASHVAHVASICQLKEAVLQPLASCHLHHATCMSVLQMDVKLAAVLQLIHHDLWSLLSGARSQ